MMLQVKLSRRSPQARRTRGRVVAPERPFPQQTPTPLPRAAADRVDRTRAAQQSYFRLVAPVSTGLVGELFENVRGEVVQILGSHRASERRHRLAAVADRRHELRERELVAVSGAP